MHGRLLIKEELNVKNVEFTDDVREFTSYTFKPQLRTCGRKFGSKLNAAKEVIANLPGKETYAALQSDSIKITVEGEEFEMAPEDFLVETKTPEGLSTQTDKGVTVSLDIKLTDELIEEGHIREVISKVQNLRRSTEGLEVVDRIELVYKGDPELTAIIETNKDFIAGEVLAVSMKEAGSDEGLKIEKVNGKQMGFALKKV